ncbi:779_t:CDS:2, partial [Diversispora eburnea]
RNTSVETNQNPSLEGKNLNVANLTNKNQIQGDDLSYYPPDDECSDSEESKKYYENTHKFPDPKYMFNLKAKGLTTPEKFISWWNKNYSNFQITVDTIKR